LVDLNIARNKAIENGKKFVKKINKDFIQQQKFCENKDIDKIEQPIEIRANLISISFPKYFTLVNCRFKTYQKRTYNDYNLTDSEKEIIKNLHRIVYSISFVLDENGKLIHIDYPKPITNTFSAQLIESKSSVIVKPKSRKEFEDRIIRALKKGEKEAEKLKEEHKRHIDRFL